MKAPAYEDNFATIYLGHAPEILRELPDGSVHCCVTSPPYWGLRSYLPGNHPDKVVELGTESSPEEYVENLVAVFREVRRVLRNDGTLWINIGDAYNSGASGGLGGSTLGGGQANQQRSNRHGRPSPRNLKHKDLIGLPWMLAFALRAEGWYLRSDIVWHKPNPMPESITDRPTKSHEYLFLLTKSPRYFYDAEAVKERGVSGASDIRKMEEGLDRIGGKHKTLEDPLSRASAATNMGRKRAVGQPGSRNRRSVWDIATCPYPGAHYATFPPDLVYPCIRAGTSEYGVCGECGSPWERMVEREPGLQAKREYDGGLSGRRTGAATDSDYRGVGHTRSHTAGWQPTCSCGGPEDLAPGDLEVVSTPIGKRDGDDPSKVTGRAGMNRPRGDEEGSRLITRYQQRRYAMQLRQSPHKETMRGEAGEAFSHYVRTDRSGARPVPEPLLEVWIERGWLERISAPAISPPERVPATVLDPFMGSGTTALAARKLGRRSVGIDLDERNLEQIVERLGAQGVLL